MYFVSASNDVLCRMLLGKNVGWVKPNKKLGMG